MIKTNKFLYLSLIALSSICAATDYTSNKIISQSVGKILTGHKNYPNLINKVTLTQKGYIQFLRYITHIPTISDFTFCIWMRSSNLTHSHPLVSYSMHEEDRLIRAWISPFGKSANLAIREHFVFKVPINLKENHWYHICQSWESKEGAWNFFLNGKLKATGLAPQIRGIKIPPKGDLVVGQEYTDFDKGLDDGIEGDIFGFNFVLAPATVHFSNSLYNFNSPPSDFYSDRRHSFISPRLNYNDQIKNIYVDGEQTVSGTQHRYYTNQGNLRRVPSKEQTSVELEAVSTSEKTDVPPVLGYFNAGVNRDPKGFKSFLGDFFNFLEPSSPKTLRSAHYAPQSYSHFNAGSTRHVFHHPLKVANRRVFSNNYPPKILNEISGAFSKPLGLNLVELSYHNCALGKGSPIDDERVLISWTKTPVRVFGGAILKTIPAFCV